MDRVDFFFKQRVTESELDQSQDFVENGLKNIVKESLGFGFLVTGAAPATVVEDSPVSLSVLVNTLLGYDQLGRRMTNALFGFQGGSDLGASPQLISLETDESAVSTAVGSGGNEKTISVFVEFTRKEQDPRTDGNGATVNFLQKESVKFNVVQSAEAGVGTSVPPPLRNDQILLMDTILIFSQTTILNAGIDQTRREDFSFLTPHGSSHVEGGADAVPNATGAVGGLHSAADKVILDALVSHGSTHVEGGSDAIPNAVTGTGGLLSAADKKRVDEVLKHFAPGPIGVASAAGTMTITSEAVVADGDVYKKLTGGADLETASIHYGFPMIGDKLLKLEVPLKFSDLAGSNDATILVKDFDGTTLFTKTTTPSVTRSVETILDSDLSSQPTGRFTVQVDIETDLNDDVFIGGILADYDQIT